MIGQGAGLLLEKFNFRVFLAKPSWPGATMNNENWSCESARIFATNAANMNQAQF
jgi:hypothetical protein